MLREDHEKVLAMLTQLESALNTAPAPDAGPPRVRKDLVTELLIAESQQESVEEQFFWALVRNVLPDDQAFADHAVSQDDAAKQVLHALEKARPDQSDFEAMVGRIIADGREHIEYEQTQVWPKVQATVSQQDLEDIGEKMAKAKKAAPTRPHPGTPANPGVQKTAGVAAALTDKIRDAIRGRGHQD